MEAINKTSVIFEKFRLVKQQPQVTFLSIMLPQLFTNQCTVYPRTNTKYCNISPITE